jgi:hypothetical protein
MRVSKLQNLIHDPIFQGFLCSHRIITITVFPHFINRLSGMVCEDLVEHFSRSHDVFCCDLDIDRLSLYSSEWLMDEDF